MLDLPRTSQHAALLDAARSVREGVESNAAQAERDGTLTPAALDALVGAGLFRAFLLAGRRSFIRAVAAVGSRIARC